MPVERPNIVMVIADQYTGSAIENDSYHTPHADAMAASGTRFSGCYSPHPQCSPTRSSLVTGLYPHQTGVQALPNWPSDDRYVLDPDANSVGRVLREAGYATGWFGRWDLGEENAGPLGWETLGLDVTGTAGIPGRNRDEQSLVDSLAFLREATEPFFLTASFNLPHRPYYVEEAFAGRYDPENLPLPENFGDDIDGKPTAHQELRPGDVPEEYSELDRLDEPAYRDLGHRYRTMVSRADSYLGELRAALEAQGVADNTAVVFTADHGDMAGGHGMIGKHTLAYEEQLRVPLIVDRPGDQVPVVDDLVSLVSIPGTLIELAGLDVPPAFEGGSLAGLLDGEGDPPSAVDGDQRIFFEHKSANGLYPLRGVRTREWKYVDYFVDDEAELYDLGADPHEMENLAGDPAHADTRERLHETVLDWWERTDGDEESWAEPVPD